jgi:hypothetical protein
MISGPIAEDRRPHGDFEERWHACELLEAVERSATARQWVDVMTGRSVTTV